MTIALASADQSTHMIVALAQTLAAPRSAIDGAFVAAGTELSECAQLITRVTGLIEVLPSDLESPDLAESSARLMVVGQRAEAIATELGSPEGDLGRLVMALGLAATPIDQLRRTVKMMGIVAVNARVVAASVVSERDDFGVFTTDISELSNSAASTVAEFFQQYQKLNAVVAEAAAARTRFAQSQREPLARVARTLHSLLEDMAAHRREAVTISAETGRMSRDIAQRVAKSVMALQVGDATRQRVEHVESALERLGTEAALAPIAAKSVELERRLLAAARESLTGEMDAAAGAVSDIVEDIDAMLRKAAELHGGGKGKQSALDALHEAVNAAVRVLGDCEVERQKLDHVALSVASTVKVLLEHVEAVEAIEYKMRLVSLNAAVKCAQLGPRGRALDVISQQLRSLTGDTVVAAGAAVKRLDEAATLSAEFAGAASGGAAGDVSALGNEAEAALALLAAVSQRMDDAIGAIERDVPRAKAKLGDVVSVLGEHGHISEQLSDAEFALAEMTGTSGDISAHADFFAQLRKTYTMDAERRIHDQFTGIKIADKPKMNEEVSLDDLMF
jgi:hypothetical protein